MFHSIDHTPANLPKANQVSGSYFFSGDDSMRQSLNGMAAQGQSYFNSSGDAGAFTGNVNDVRTFDNVTVVGGTTLNSFGAGMPPSESVWSQGNGASGGGFFGPYVLTTAKSSFPVGGLGIPGYQLPFVTAPNTANLGSSSYRNFPDVSMVAQNVEEVITTSAGSGVNNNSGGTSASSPMWAAFMALANEKASQNGVVPVGFANPVLYKIASNSALYKTCFNDVNDGTGNPTSPAGSGGFTNDPNSLPPATGFPAVTGYDLATGLGSPTCALIAQLGSPTPLIPVPPPPPPPPPPPTTPTTETFAGIGKQDTCGIISGSVECWGQNNSGQDGNNTASPQPNPVCVKNIAGIKTATQVVQGSSHSCALISDGSVWCWGDNSVGELGAPTPGSASTPIVASSLAAVDAGNLPTQIAAGGETTWRS